MNFYLIIYNLVILPLAYLLLHLVALKNLKIRRAIQERQGLHQRFVLLQQKRDSSKPLIWFHVASAGEMMQAQPVIERFLYNHYECLLTFSSPTGKDWVTRLTVSKEIGIFCEYLPWDCPLSMHRILKLFVPCAMVYVHSELIPNLIWTAQRHQIPQFLISAVLRADSPRVKFLPVRHFYQTLYQCLKGIFTASPIDQKRFSQLLPQHPLIHYLGETRFDCVLDRKKRLPKPDIPFSLTDKIVFIFGSSWPQDETYYLPALQKMLLQYPQLLAIIAPHEIDADHLAQLETALQKFCVMRFSKMKTKQTPQVLLIDCIGILSSLYQIGSLAYIGGGFSTGVHNIIEPCAMGLPVIFGKWFQNSAEARSFVMQDFAWSVENGQQIQVLFERFLNQPQELSELGAKALASVEHLSGASQLCFEVIHKCLIRISDTSKSYCKRTHPFCCCLTSIELQCLWTALTKFAAPCSTFNDM